MNEGEGGCKCRQTCARLDTNEVLMVTMKFNRKMVTTLPMAAHRTASSAGLADMNPSDGLFYFERQKTSHPADINFELIERDKFAFFIIDFVTSLFFGSVGVGAPRLLAAMAMRRLVASSLRARSFCSSSTSSAQLSGVQELVEPVLTHGEIGEVSGIPEEHLKRKVVIYSPSRCTTQSGPATSQWKISFESVNKWENPLMGWTSTGDPYHSVGEASLNFNSRERAVEFAEKYGWQYTVREPHQAALKPRAYADNFKWKGPVPEFD